MRHTARQLLCGGLPQPPKPGPKDIGAFGVGEAGLV